MLCAKLLSLKLVRFGGMQIIRGLQAPYHSPPLPSAEQLREEVDLLLDRAAAAPVLRRAQALHQPGGAGAGLVTGLVECWWLRTGPAGALLVYS